MTDKPRPIRLMVGLGNPGDKYFQTRHNAGFWFVDGVARHAGAVWRFESRFSAEVASLSAAGQELRLLKPQAYMNRSGDAVGAFLHYFRLTPADMLVAHDELDLEPGTIRLKAGGGHGGHNGLRDIHRVLGPDYWRLRIGIGHPGHRSQVVSYVLNRADAEAEASILESISRAIDELDNIVAGKMQPVMNRLHSS